MSAAWVSFGVVIIMQVTFLVLTALYFRKSISLKLLFIGIVIGTPIGLLYDTLLGGYFGLFSYKLGFEIPFLMVNAALSYGLFITTALLLQRVSTIYFVAWISLLILVYEVANFFFPVWSYNFTLPLLPFFILCLVGYSSGALLASCIAASLFKQPFVLEIQNKSLKPIPKSSD